MTIAAQFEYVSPREVGVMLDKGKSRVYEMIAQGLLDDVGFHVLRLRGRIWVGVPLAGSFFEQREKAYRECYSPETPFSFTLEPLPFLSTKGDCLDSG